MMAAWFDAAALWVAISWRACFLLLGCWLAISFLVKHAAWRYRLYAMALCAPLVLLLVGTGEGFWALPVFVASRSQTFSSGFLANGQWSSVPHLMWLAGICFSIWFLGVVLLVFRDVKSGLQAWGLVKRGKVICSPRVERIVTDIARAVGCKPPKYVLQPEIHCPMIWGPPRAVLLLPKLALRWDEAQLRGVIAHELAHLKRYDFCKDTLLRLQTILLWHVPFTYLVRKDLDQAREEACDAWAVALGTPPVVMAKYLLNVTTGCEGHRLKALGGSSITGRIVYLLKGRPRSLHAALLALLAGAVCISLATVHLDKVPKPSRNVTLEAQERPARWSQFLMDSQSGNGGDADRPESRPEDNQRIVIRQEIKHIIR